MTTTPNVPVPDEGERSDAAPPQPDSAAGVEIGMSKEGSTFEPEEDDQAEA
jgi:hypothetical protein